MRNGFNVYVGSDLYEAGRQSDDGQPFIAENFFAMIEFEDGRRFRHEVTLPGAHKEVCDETGEWYFTDIRPQSRARIERLVAKIVEIGTVDFERWTETEPAYGSQAYQDMYC